MQLDRGGEAIILAGAMHILSHKVDMSLYPMFNANAHPAYQYFNADKSVALVTGQSIQNNRTTDILHFFNDDNIFFVVFFV
jgi:hypothetical protein